MDIRNEFAHAILEARLRESFISVEYKEPPSIGLKNSLPLAEPLHDSSPARVLEAVENLACRISSLASRSRCKVVVTPLTVMSSDVRIIIIEFKEIQ